MHSLSSYVCEHRCCENATEYAVMSPCNMHEREGTGLGCTSDFTSIAGKRSTMRFNSPSESCKFAFSHPAIRLTEDALTRSLLYRRKTRLRSTGGSARCCMLCNIFSIFSKLRARNAGHVFIACLAICIDFHIRTLGEPLQPHCCQLDRVVGVLCADRHMHCPM